MKKTFLKWSLLACSAMALGQAQGSLITFDDLVGTQAAVPAGYGGLVWQNFYYIKYTDFGVPAVNAPQAASTTQKLDGSGYYYGAVSRENVVFNGFGSSAAMQDGSFTLTSAYLTAAWRDNLQVNVVGKFGNTVLYDRTYTLSATAPTFIEFNYAGVNSVTFYSSGGVNHGYNGDGTHFVMDNVLVQVVPEPSTLAAGAMLLAPLGMAVVRRLRRS